MVQQALDLASKGRTTIVVSHRLSAIRGADKIVFIHEGKVLEEGSHDDLMALEGAYYNMVRAGDINMPEDAEKDENIDEAKRRLHCILIGIFEAIDNLFPRQEHCFV